MRIYGITKNIKETKKKSPLHFSSVNTIQNSYSVQAFIWHGADVYAFISGVISSKTSKSQNYPLIREVKSFSETHKMCKLSSAMHMIWKLSE